MPEDIPIQYNISFEGTSQVLINWGSDPGWVEKYRPLIDQAERVSLIPKKGVPLPCVTVSLAGGKEWVVFSKVFGRMAGESNRRIRLYCIGWKLDVGGKTIVSKTWVYPNGTVEQGAEPTYAGLFLAGQ